MTRTDDKESVLSRWSRRKLEAEKLAPAMPEAAAVEIEVDPSPGVADEARPVLTDADMPSIETLTEDSDFSGFMSEGVSDELRNLALRKLFRAPVFNIRDGLDEYDEDYTSFEKLGDIVTADMKHRIEMQEQKLREKLAAEAEAEEELAALEDEAGLEVLEDEAGLEVLEDEAELEPSPQTLASVETESDAAVKPGQETENGQ